MMDSLYIGATGMHAQQQHVDSIANNLANINTNGYKRNRISFEDAFYRASAPATPGNEAQNNRIVLGMGTLVSSNTKSFAGGDLKQTDGPLDLAIRGTGFLEVVLADGTVAYTRHGALKVLADGRLATTAGYALRQEIRVPTDAAEVIIAPTGLVTARVPDQAEPVELGEINVASVPNPESLAVLGENLYAATPGTGPVTVGNAGSLGLGTLAQGYLESSNVRPAEEMVNLVLAQRAYELNAKVIQAADEMLGISNNLRR
jgi:flagellar basal-body rod protein FlgG